MNHLIHRTSNGVLEEMLQQRAKGEKPQGATSTYTVRWFLASDSFSASLGPMLGSAPTSKRLFNHKTFVTKEKADNLKKEIEAAFITLGYGLEGRVYIEEDWYE